jgi:hypothetical protein
MVSLSFEYVEVLENICFDTWVLKVIQMYGDGFGFDNAKLWGIMIHESITNIQSLHFF